MLAVAINFHPDSVQLGLKSLRLLLECGDGSHAAVNWIADASVRFVHQAARSIGALILRHLHQHLRDITGTEDFMNASEFLGLLRREVGREGALLGASSP